MTTPAPEDLSAPLGNAGLYLHIPFCSSICPYCDFSVLTGGAQERAHFVGLLLWEMCLWEGHPWHFDSIYLGGGTPSALSPAQLGAVLEASEQHFSVLPGAKIFLEANPEDVDRRSLAAWRRLGVHTLSLGVQTFEADGLRFLGRRHTPRQAVSAVEEALGAGFDTVSLDLIYGLPGQEAEAWKRDLRRAVELAPQHVSCYQLTVHEGTPFGFRRDRGQLQEMDPEGQGALFRLTHRFLRGAGYPAYEVSNFAVSEEHRSLHNRKYWRHRPYLGLGPSAHSFHGRRRWWNHRKLGPWRQGLEAGERPIESSEDLEPSDLALEALMLGLRTEEGVDLRRIEERWGISLLEANRPLVEELGGQGLVRLEGSNLVPTLEGWAVADGLAARFEI